MLFTAANSKESFERIQVPSFDDRCNAYYSMNNIHQFIQLNFLSTKISAAFCNKVCTMIGHCMML